MYNSNHIQVLYIILLLWTFYSIAPSGEQVPTLLFYINTGLKVSTLVGAFIGFAVVNCTTKCRKPLLAHHIIDILIHTGLSVDLLSLPVFYYSMNVLIYGATILKLLIVSMWIYTVTKRKETVQQTLSSIEFGSVLVEPLPAYTPAVEPKSTIPHKNIVIYHE
jgi:hypothetical protein